MATVAVRRVEQDYESQKLQEAFRLHEVPLNRAEAEIYRLPTPPREAVRTHRFKRDHRAIVLTPVAFVPAAVALLFASVALLVL